MKTKKDNLPEITHVAIHRDILQKARIYAAVHAMRIRDTIEKAVLELVADEDDGK